MEGRRSRGNTICELILEDKCSILKNLEQLTVKVISIAQHNNKTQKDIFKNHSCLLDILKQTSFINSTLEILLEELDESSSVCSAASKKETETQPIQVQIHTLETQSQLISNSTPSSNEDTFDNFYTCSTDCSFDETKTHSTLNNSTTDFAGRRTDIKDFYNKPATILLADPCISESKPHYSPKNFETPEKDTNISNDFTGKEFTTVGTSVGNSTSLDSSVKDDYSDLDLPQFDSGSHYMPKENNCIKDQNIPTALKKINNYLIDDKGSVDNLPSPDIKLKPIETVVKKEISDSEKKLGKMKKGKNTQKKVPYELHPKQDPNYDDECTICHIQSPNEFYIHVNDEITSSVDDISEVLAQYFMKNKRIQYSNKEEALNDIGKYGLLLFQKDWYRVEILNEYRDQKNDNVLVQLVDFGNKKVVSYQDLHRMTKGLSGNSILHYPKLAISCHLPLLYPPDSTRLNRLSEWPQSTIDVMSSICDMNSSELTQNSFFKLVYINKEGSSYAVDLYRVDLDCTKTLGQMLLDMGLAVQIVDDFDENNLELETFIDDIDDIETDNINEVITGYDPRDEARICRFTRPNGTCYKKHCKLEHIPFLKDGFTTDKEQLFTEAMYSLSIPKKESLTTVLITGNIEVCRFYAQIISIPYFTGKYIMDRDLHYLNEEMNSVGIIKTYEPFKIYPALGEIVLVRHWNNRWSRAVVREYIPTADDAKRAVQVYVLDYGEFQTPLIKDIRKIKPEFLKLPFQAVECYLQDYTLSDKCVRSDADKFFDKNLYLHNFWATIKSSNLPLKVELKNEYLTMDVGQTLEKMGYAINSKIDINVSDNYRIDLS